IASLELFEETHALERVGALERQLRLGLDSLRPLACVGDVRVIGGVGIVELRTEPSSTAAGSYLDAIGPRLAQMFLDRGLLLRPLGNILYVMPPYVITERETNWVLEQIGEV